MLCQFQRKEIGDWRLVRSQEVHKIWRRNFKLHPNYWSCYCHSPLTTHHSSLTTHKITPFVTLYAFFTVLMLMRYFVIILFFSLIHKLSYAQTDFQKSAKLNSSVSVQANVERLNNIAKNIFLEFPDSAHKIAAN